jgi:hypothetical protein
VTLLGTVSEAIAYNIAISNLTKLFSQKRLLKEVEVLNKGEDASQLTAS